jgi:large subunit ribosomal protein L30
MKIKLIKSLIGRKDSHIATAKSLGLKKIGDVTEQPDNAATRGKIHEISYLIEVM